MQVSDEYIRFGIGFFLGAIGRIVNGFTQRLESLEEQSKEHEAQLSEIKAELRGIEV